MKSKAMLIVLWLMLGGAAGSSLFWIWQHPPRLPAVTAPKPEPLHMSPLAPFSPTPLPQYAGIVERPVFSEARRPDAEQPPLAPEPPAPPPPPPEQPLHLIGVVLLPDRAAALLRLEETEVVSLPVRAHRPGSAAPLTKINSKVLRVLQGDTVEGWQLASVEANKVVLRRNQEVRELALVRPTTPPRNPAARELNAAPNAIPPNRAPAPTPVAPPIQQPPPVVAPATESPPPY